MSTKEKEKNGNKKSKKDKIGCTHYERKCSFVSPCCNKEYICRICHDENENHEIDRHTIKKIKCLLCEHVQPVQKVCESCQSEFGRYFCKTCRLFDDVERGQFHCDGCGLCRIGGRENFFHCGKCDMCLSVKLEGHHKCVEKSSRRDCAICLEDLHTSRVDGHIPRCGHLIHRSCFEKCVQTGNYACPTCAESLLDMKPVWQQLDVEVAQTEMPEEYKDFHVYILCRDCHKEGKVLFHVLGLKCSHCGSYNTCRAADPDAVGNGKASASSADHVDPAQPNSSAPAEEAQPNSSSIQSPSSQNHAEVMEGASAEMESLTVSPSDQSANGATSGSTASASHTITDQPNGLAQNDVLASEHNPFIGRK